MRKRVLAAVLTLAMMFSLSVSASAANTTVRTEDVKISVDGKTVDVPKGSIWISEDGYTMVGARALAEGFYDDTVGLVTETEKHEFWEVRE